MTIEAPFIIPLNPFLYFAGFKFSNRPKTKPLIEIIVNKDMFMIASELLNKVVRCMPRSVIIKNKIVMIQAGMSK